MTTKRSINFDNVDKAFHGLAGTPAGTKALEGFQKAIDGLSAGAGVSLTDHEVNYVASNLAKQYRAKAASQGSRVVGGFVIKTAVDAE